jgi:hypothetical protein
MESAISVTGASSAPVTFERRGAGGAVRRGLDREGVGIGPTGSASIAAASGT